LIKLSQLVPFIEQALSDIDTTLYISRKRQRVASVPLSWLVAAVIWFSATGMTCWKRYVFLMLPLHLSKYRLSYSRWSYWRKELGCLIQALAERLCIKQAYRGVALADATALPVCSIQRQRDHKCLAEHASKGCGSLGWFYGLKLHLIISDAGELLRFWLSTGKAHDTAPLFHDNYLRGLEGLLVGDSGYRVRKGRTVIKEEDLAIIARPTKVKNEEMPWALRQLFQARWLVETTYSELKENLGLRVSRSCKCLSTFMTCVHSSLIVYTLERRLKRA
jgi:hypothetical protein